MFEVDVAGLGEAKLARRAMQELRAKPRLQILDLAADRGLRQSQRSCGGNEAAVLHDFDEDQRVVEIPGHGRSLSPIDWPLNWDNYFQNYRLIKWPVDSYRRRRERNQCGNYGNVA